jgi:NAD(P)-dependent dehydrogenase (short-subunit alcohol dehydrogenase family)
VKTVLITGASGGIGAATARLAAAKGWRVFAGYRKGRERAEAVGDAVQISLEDPASILAAVAFLKTKTDKLDAVVLCAGLPPPLLPFVKTDEAALFEQLRVCAGHSRLIAELWKAFFVKAKAGHVVGVSSQAARTPPWPGFTSYVVAKRALEASLECAKVELGKDGLRVSVIRPGYTETPMLLALNPHVLDAIRAKAGPEGLLSPETVGAQILALLDGETKKPTVLKDS